MAPGPRSAFEARWRAAHSSMSSNYNLDLYTLIPGADATDCPIFANGSGVMCYGPIDAFLFLSVITPTPPSPS